MYPPYGYVYNFEQFISTGCIVQNVCLYILLVDSVSAYCCGLHTSVVGLGLGICTCITLPIHYRDHRCRHSRPDSGKSGGICVSTPAHNKKLVLLSVWWRQDDKEDKTPTQLSNTIRWLLNNRKWKPNHPFSPLLPRLKGFTHWRVNTYFSHALCIATEHRHSIWSKDIFHIFRATDDDEDGNDNDNG